PSFHNRTSYLPSPNTPMASRRTSPPEAPTREEFATLDTARIKLDEDLASVRSTIESHGSDIGELQTSVSALHNKFDKLIAILNNPPPPTTSSAPSTTSGPAPDTSDASTSSAAPGKWNSAAAAYPEGKAPQASSDIRIQSSMPSSAPPSTTENGRSFTIKPDELGTFDGVPEDTALFLANIEAIRATENDPSWEKALLRALPRTLRGAARLWFASLTELER
ncbi:unnamed protein product, partial [Tilletia caries]